ncbi:MAG: ECF transporter S component [Acutalibacteraceae bacterium]
MKRDSEKKLFKLALAAIFIAIIIIMTFTSLGYIKVGVIEITLLTIPVAVGGLLLGKLGGLLLGGVFGLTSFIQCFGMSAFGAALLEINPILTFLVCMLPRLAVGFFGTWIFEAFSKTKLNANVSALISFLCSSLINTIGFVGLLLLFFGRTEYVQSVAASLGAQNMFIFFFLFAGFNSVVEAVACSVCGGALGGVLMKLKAKMN